MSCHERIRRVLPVALLGVACARTQQPVAAPPSSGVATETRSDVIVAEYDGARISEAELQRYLRNRLAPLRQQEYEIRVRALEDLAHEKLLAREASARGVSSAELLKKEVDEKAAAPTTQEITALYERNKPRLGGRSREEVEPEITRILRERRREERREAFRRELAKRARLRVLVEPPRAEVTIPSDAPILGSAVAPITIVEFADYECPYCQRAQAMVDDLLSRNKGKVRFVHLDFPIDGHPRAFSASRAARCAGEQGRFWEYRRELLRLGVDLTDDALRGHARRLGLKPEPFSACLDSGRHDAAIHASVAEGSGLGVSATPTFFVNGRMVVGARSLEEFQQILNEETAAHR